MRYAIRDVSQCLSTISVECKPMGKSQLRKVGARRVAAAKWNLEHAHGVASTDAASHRAWHGNGPAEAGLTGQESSARVCGERMCKAWDLAGDQHRVQRCPYPWLKG